MGGELDALGFAARKGGGGLAEADVAEADLVENVELVDDPGMAGEVGEGLLDGHVEDVVDVLVAVLDLEDGGFVTGSVAFFAGELDIGEELHFDGDGAVALADVAAAAGDVEGEHAGGETAALGVWLRGEEGADVVKGLDVGDGVGARGAADGGLVDEDDVVEVPGAGELAVEMGGRRCLAGFFAVVECLHEGAVEDLVDEGGFAGAGDAGDAAEEIEGDVEVDAAEVVDAGAGEQEVFAAGLAAVLGDGDEGASGEVAAGDGVGVGGDFGDGSGGEELAAELAGAGAEVEQVVGGADDVRVVLDDEDGVAEVAEVLHDADELGGIAGVEADRRLVEDVESADEAGAERGGELDALGFAAREGGREAVEGEVVEADLVEEADALADLFEDLAGDLGLCGRELEVVEEAGGGGDGEGGGLADVFVAEEDGAGFGAEALPRQSGQVA